MHIFMKIKIKKYSKCLDNCRNKKYNKNEVQTIYI